MALKNNSRTIESFVDRFEELLRQRDAVMDDLKELKAEARRAEFGKRDIKAMERIARWRKDDKRETAQADLAALKRVSSAVSFDLFDWAEDQL